MLVDAVELRYRGEKRSREEVLEAVPLRAVLSLSPGRPGWHSGSRNPPLMAGLVVPGRAEWATPPLDQARVTTIKGGSLLVVGVQELRSGRNYESFPQAWWCRVVGTGIHAQRISRTAPVYSDEFSRARGEHKKGTCRRASGLLCLRGQPHLPGLGRLRRAPRPWRDRVRLLPETSASQPCFVLNDVEASVGHVSIEKRGHASPHLLCARIRSLAGDAGDGAHVPVLAARRDLGLPSETQVRKVLFAPRSVRLAIFGSVDFGEPEFHVLNPVRGLASSRQGVAV